MVHLKLHKNTMFPQQKYVFGKNHFQNKNRQEEGRQWILRWKIKFVNGYKKRFVKVQY